MSNAETVATAVVDFAGLVFQTAPFRPTKLPDGWPKALTAWLLGSPAGEVVRAGGKDGVEFLQDGIMYRLAWSIEAVRVHAAAIGDEAVEDIEGLAAMAAETGSVVRPAIILLRAGLGSREAAHAAVNSTGASFVDGNGMMDWLTSDEVLDLHRNQEWPTPGSRSAWERFVELKARDPRRRWRHERQLVRVDWRSEAPPIGADVIIEPAGGPGSSLLVLLPDFTPVGLVLSLLRYPRCDIVSAQVAQRRNTVRIEYLGKCSAPADDGQDD